MPKNVTCIKKEVLKFNSRFPNHSNRIPSIENLEDIFPRVTIELAIHFLIENLDHVDTESFVSTADNDNTVASY